MATVDDIRKRFNQVRKAHAVLEAVEKLKTDIGEENCPRCSSPRVSPDGLECADCGWKAEQCKSCSQFFTRWESIPLDVKNICYSCYTDAMVRGFS